MGIEQYEPAKELRRNVFQKQADVCNTLGFGMMSYPSIVRCLLDHR